MQIWPICHVYIAHRIQITTTAAAAAQHRTDYFSCLRSKLEIFIQVECMQNRLINNGYREYIVGKFTTLLHLPIKMSLFLLTAGCLHIFEHETWQDYYQQYRHPWPFDRHKICPKVSTFLFQHPTPFPIIHPFKDSRILLPPTV